MKKCGVGAPPPSIKHGNPVKTGKSCDDIDKTWQCNCSLISDISPFVRCYPRRSCSTLYKGNPCHKKKEKYANKVPSQGTLSPIRTNPKTPRASGNNRFDSCRSTKNQPFLTMPNRKTGNIAMKPNSEHGRVLGRLQTATVIGFEWRNSSREPIQVKGCLGMSWFLGVRASQTSSEFHSAKGRPFNRLHSN